ncbi:MAG: hypothetical protein HY775_03460 [Acidobacteria bacterium]|nr:hypothetical protein [Acidobacteriota bacterium]
MIPTASLKAFEPLAAFDDVERARWEQCASRGRHGTTQRTVILSREAGLGGAIATAVADHDEADLLARDGKIFACPHRTRLRLLASIVAFRGSIPDEAAPAFLPEEEFERALTELRCLHVEHPGWRTHILQSAWEVPLRWFVLFDPSERRLVPFGGRPSIRYETAIAAARRRAARALHVLGARLPSSTVIGLLEDLAEWLEEFHEDSRIVLEYGEVAGLLGAGEIGEDTTARDIWDALRALERGDNDGAAASYSQAAERWARVRAHESAN